MSKVYSIVTDEIIKRLEAGTVPWRKPWRTRAANGMPANLISGKKYRGVNTFLLWTSDYGSNYWLTFNQAKDLGGHVKQGEHGTPIIFWTEFEKETEKGPEKLPVLRYYRVFNSEQCEGIAHKRLAEVTANQPELIPFEPIEVAESVVSAMPQKPAIEHGGESACYVPSRDLVKMPEPGRFDHSEGYYSTLFHELVHSTGHESRLDRRHPAGTVRWFGSAEYSREELVAEMGAAMLCGHCRIEQATLDNSAAYLASWIKVLREDSKAVVMAAAMAQKAADFILGGKGEK